jgi:hypothetical protein
MPSQRNAQSACNKGKLYLAIKATQATPPNSTRHASKAFDVPQTTLIDRRNRTLARRDCKPNSRKLTKLEEKAIVARILKLDARGIGATRTIVAEIANNLLAARSKAPISIN